MTNLNNHSFLPLGPYWSPPSPNPKSMPGYAIDLYFQAWEEYRNAGSPYGTTDEAMLVWYSLSPGAGVIGPVTGRN